MFHQELVFPAGFVDIDPAARQYSQPVLRLDFPVAVGRTEGHCLHLRFLVFQREVVVAACRQFETRDLTGHRNIGELPVQIPRIAPLSSLTLKTRRCGKRSKPRSNCSTYEW